ncbi:protein enabled-like protein [Raphanus sativus]|nr:protein enabled-like protein [Raphanus sativus]
MKSVWKVSGKASDLNPAPFTSGEPPIPPPLPPDPPDPTSSLSPVQFPPLSSSKTTGSRLISSLKVGSEASKSFSTAGAPLLQFEPKVCETPANEHTAENASETITPDSQTSRSTVTSTVQPSQTETSFQNFKILPPKSSSPINTNKASTSFSSLPPPTSRNPAPPPAVTSSKPSPDHNSPPISDPILPTPTPSPIVEPNNTTPSVSPASSTPSAPTTAAVATLPWWRK